MSKEYRLGDLAREVGGRVVGDAELPIRGVATLERAGPDQLGFLTNVKYREAARRSRAGAILVPPDSGLEREPRLEVAEAYLALARILELFHPPTPRRAGISSRAEIGRDVRLGVEVAVGAFAVVEDEAVLDDRASVGPGCVVGRGARVGEETTLMPGVVLYPGTVVGRRCLIHSGVVLGGDGFGFATSGGRHHKVPQLGRVVVEDDVEIGANTTVDRGTLDETVVGAGSKLDDQVMIAHGVRLGPGCLLAAQSGVAGSSRIGSHVTFAGQSGAAGHLEIGDKATVAAKTAVFADVAAGSFVAGIPAVDHRRWKRSQALVQRLPELQRELRALRREIARLRGEPSPEES